MGRRGNVLERNGRKSISRRAAYYQEKGCPRRKPENRSIENTMIRHPIDYLEILWQKPESTRKKILVVSVILISSVVITAWLMTFSVPPITQPFSPATQEQAPISSIWELSRQVFKPESSAPTAPTNETGLTETDNYEAE